MSDSEYRESRVQQEREAADKATNENAKAAHEKMAELYGDDEGIPPDGLYIVRES